MRLRVTARVAMELRVMVPELYPAAPPSYTVRIHGVHSPLHPAFRLVYCVTRTLSYAVGVASAPAALDRPAPPQARDGRARGQPRRRAPSLPGSLHSARRCLPQGSRDRMGGGGVGTLFRATDSIFTYLFRVRVTGTLTYPNQTSCVIGSPRCCYGSRPVHLHASDTPDAPERRGNVAGSASRPACPHGRGLLLQR